MDQSDLPGLFLDPLLRLLLQILSPKAEERLILLRGHNYRQAIRKGSLVEKLRIVMQAGLLV